MVGSPGCGRIALTHSARTLPGVSFPSSVVRSIIRIARSSAHIFDAFLIDRRFRAVDPLLDPDLVHGGHPAEQVPERSGPRSHARMSSFARSRAGLSGCLVAVMGRRGYTSVSRDPGAAGRPQWPNPDNAHQASVRQQTTVKCSPEARQHSGETADSARSGRNSSLNI